MRQYDTHAAGHVTAGTSLQGDATGMDDFDFYRLYKTLHVLSVALLAGGITIETVIGPLLPRAGSVQELRAYTRVMKIAENFIILPATLLVIGFGYATASRLNIDLDVTWLLFGQILTYAAAIISLAYLRTAALRADRMARAAPDGPVPEELVRETKNPGPAIVGTLMLIIFIFIVYLMVAQPAW
jgi:uncharacterized membrane protein